MKDFSIKLIQKYQKKISPRLTKKGIRCSFYPSCSEYGRLALQKYGLFKGWFKTIKRILKCNTYRHEESCIDYP